MIIVFRGDISKEFPIVNIKKNILCAFVFDFSVACNIIDTSDIVDIHKYLMKKHENA